MIQLYFYTSLLVAKLEKGAFSSGRLQMICGVPVKPFLIRDQACALMLWLGSHSFPGSPHRQGGTLQFSLQSG